MPPRYRGCPLFLASVRSADEAALCLRAGADIIDAKDPANGALGRLSSEGIAAISRLCRDTGKLLSATIGDEAAHPAAVVQAVTQVASAGCDFVKIGLPDGPLANEVVEASASAVPRDIGLVGVFFADRGFDLRLLETMARAGFKGALLDTADKALGPLTGVITPETVAGFVNAAHRCGLFAGVAGRLRASDVAPLAGANADIMGFRSALCLDSNRNFAVHETLVQAVRGEIDAIGMAAPADQAVG